MKKTLVVVMAAVAILFLAGSAMAVTDHFNAGGKYTGIGSFPWDDVPYTNYSFTVVDQGGDAWYGTNGYQGANTVGVRSAITPGNYTNEVYTISSTIDSLQLINQTSGALGSWFTMGLMANVGGFDQSASGWNSYMNNKPGVYLGFGKDATAGYYGFLKNGTDPGADVTIYFDPTGGATFSATFNGQTGLSGLSINGGPMQYATLDTSMLGNAVGIAQLYHGSNDPYSTTNQSFIYLSDLNVSAAAVPEPATMLLLGLGLMGIAGIRRKFRS